MTRRQAHRGKDIVSGRGQSIGTQAQRSIGLNRLIDVKVQRIRLQRHIANPLANPLTSDDPVAMLARSNPNASPAAWKLAAEKSFRRQRAQALRPLSKT